MKRVGLLGGAFNPPHEGHLKLARIALAQLELDELRFVPTALSPHKPTPGDVSDAQRLELLRAAVACLDPRCSVETLELERGGTSYTADTLEALSAREPGAAWVLVLGSDQLPGLPRWHRAARVFELASVAAAPRPGAAAETPAGLRLSGRWNGAAGAFIPLPGTGLDLASSQLREQLRHDAVTGGIPAPVMAAIRAEKLYR
jgi:nicotinate-nucleotide adenylyltransferase